MEVFLLLDRTGSMQIRWGEAINAINVYVDELRKAMGEDLLTDADRITLAVFDRWSSGTQFDVLRDAIPLHNWTPLSTSEVTPRGDTPLLDAVVRMAAIVERRKAQRSIMVVMTDGEENASHEVTKAQAKAALDGLQAKDWQVVFLGANFDAFHQEAGGLGITRRQTMSMSPGNYGRGMSATAHNTALYASSGQPMSYTDAQREESGEDEVIGGTWKKPKAD